MTADTAAPAPAAIPYDTLRAAQLRLFRVLADRLTRQQLHHAMDELAVPVMNGKARLREQRHLDAVVDYAIHGSLRNGRNFAAQSLTTKWPADPAERIVLAAAAQARFIFAQVDESRPNEGIHITDLMGAKLFIHDRAIGTDAKPGQGLASFLIRMPGVDSFSGATFMLPWDRPFLDQLRRSGTVRPSDQPLTAIEREKLRDHAAAFIAARVS